jgi:uncharacterized protein with ParB-like and HNH nuclease domain/predicted transport protein
MKAIDRNFTKIINGTTQFVIPVFQRDYKWNEPQCEQLWKDIIDIANNQSQKGHFIGSIVYIQTGDTSAGFTRWLLIDGQQRVTTLMLLLAALRDHITHTKWQGTNNDPTAKKIDAYFLRNMEEDGERQLKLILRRKDKLTLKAIIEGTELPKNFSEHIYDNYEYFMDQIANSDPGLVFRGISRLIIVDVILDKGIDDPQLIFESLNSTGIALSQSDLIRNFVLMRLPVEEQTYLYETYWQKIENMFSGSITVFDNFLRDYIALKTQPTKQEKAGDIYISFRRNFEYLKNITGDIESLMMEMVKYARYYSAFSFVNLSNDSLALSLKYLRRLVDAPGILVMKLFECYSDLKTLSKTEFVQGLGIIESYIFRRAICGLQTRGYWLVFAKIAYKVTSATPLQDLKVELARKGDNYRFPSNTEFYDALYESNIYRLRICKHLLDRIENFEMKEISDTSQYSIEHILPQNENLNSSWQEMIGDNWVDVQKTWLHRIGNLTLTAYNSVYSDRPFEEKKTISGGFIDSSVRLNKFIREQEVWTQNEIKIRSELLTKQALLVWPELTVDPQLINIALRNDMKELASKRDVLKVSMSPKSRDLFNQLRDLVKNFDDDILELAESKSVSYHGSEYFMEILPRKYHLHVLLPISYSEVSDPLGFVKDASEWKFFFHAQYEGGIVLELKTIEEVELALPIIQLSYISSNRS